MRSGVRSPSAPQTSTDPRTARESVAPGQRRQNAETAEPRCRGRRSRVFATLLRASRRRVSEVVLNAEAVAGHLVRERVRRILDVIHEVVLGATRDELQEQPIPE